MYSVCPNNSEFPHQAHNLKTMSYGRQLKQNITKTRHNALYILAAITLYSQKTLCVTFDMQTLFVSFK